MQFFKRECDFKVCIRENYNGSRKLSFFKAYHKECAKEASKRINDINNHHLEYLNQENGNEEKKLQIDSMDRAISFIERGIESDLNSNKVLKDTSNMVITIVGVLLSFLIGSILASEKVYDFIFIKNLYSLSYYPLVFSITSLYLSAVLSLYFGTKVITPKKFGQVGTNIEGWYDLDYLQGDKQKEKRQKFSVIANYFETIYQNDLSLKENDYFISIQLFFFKITLCLLAFLGGCVFLLKNPLF